MSPEWSTGSCYSTFCLTTSVKDSRPISFMVCVVLFNDCNVSISLPLAEVHLDTSRSNDELYHEDYRNVAVMFASIPNYMDYFGENDEADGGLHCLEVLNQIISGFDAVINLSRSPFAIIMAKSFGIKSF